MYGQWYGGDTLLKGLTQDFAHIAATLGRCIQEAHAVVREGHFAGVSIWPPPIRPSSAMVWWGTRHGRVVTRAVRSRVGPVT